MSSSAQRWRVVPRIGQEAVERARLRVVPRVRARAPRVPFVILVSVVLLAGTVGLLLFNTSMQQAAFTGAALEERADVLNARKQTLTGEVEQLRDPQRLAEAAAAQGMVPATTPAILDLGSGEIVLPGVPASPEDALNIETPDPEKPAELTPAPIYRDVPAPASGEQPAQPTQPTQQGEQPAAGGEGSEQDLPNSDDPAQQ